MPFCYIAGGRRRCAKNERCLLVFFFLSFFFFFFFLFFFSFFLFFSFFFLQGRKVSAAQWQFVFPLPQCVHRLRTVPEIFEDRSEVVLGTCKERSGIVLGSFWGRSECSKVVSDLFEDHSRIVPEIAPGMFQFRILPFQNRSRIVLRTFQERSWTVRARLF